MCGVVWLSLDEVASLYELPRRPKDDSVGVVELLCPLASQLELYSLYCLYTLPIVRRSSQVGLQALSRVGEGEVTHRLDAKALYRRIAVLVEGVIYDPAYHLVGYSLLPSRRRSIEGVGLLLRCPRWGLFNPHCGELRRGDRRRLRVRPLGLVPLHPWPASSARWP